MALNTNRLQTGAAELGLNLETEQLERFSRFVRWLYKENAKHNLVGTTDPEVILVRHILDSLSVAGQLNVPSGAHVLDIGSGAGLPGIPLAIALPETRFTLMDTSRKRTNFLRSFVDASGLENIEVARARAEEAAREPKWRESFDGVVARAVAPLPTLIEYALPFLKTGGRLVAQRGPKAPEEVVAAERAVHELRGGPPEIVKVRVPYLDAERRLVIIEKVGPTPDRYPRRTGVPLKRPL